MTPQRVAHELDTLVRRPHGRVVVFADVRVQLGEDQTLDLVLVRLANERSAEIRCPQGVRQIELHPTASLIALLRQIERESKNEREERKGGRDQYRDGVLRLVSRPKLDVPA